MFIINRLRYFWLELYIIPSNWGIPRGWVGTNPTNQVPKIERPSDLKHRDRAWTRAEIDAVLQAAPKHLALPIALGVYTGIREGDVLRLPWSAIKGGIITWRQSKTEEPLSIPIHRNLAPIIEAAKRRHVTIVVGKKGQP